MNVLVIGNYARNLVIFRGPLLRGLVARGHHVTTSAPENDPWVVGKLGELGVSFRSVPLARASLNAAGDLVYVWRMARLCAAVRPDVVLSFTHKPNTLGILACQSDRAVPGILLVEGLGYSFIDEGDSLRRRISRFVLLGLYRLSLSLAHAIVFLNPNDRARFETTGVIPRRVSVRMLDGIGVDLNRFSHSEVPAGSPVFLMVARLLKTKGVMEYCEAARLVKARYPDARFKLLGATDPSNDGISHEYLASFVREGVIEYHQETNDVASHYRTASVYVLPSYREGMPVTIMEAMASGRAVISTDVPGCRDTVSNGVSGFLVPPKEAIPLADAMQKLIAQPDLAVSMGRAGRKIAERRFDSAKLTAFQVDLLETAARSGGEGRVV